MPARPPSQQAQLCWAAVTAGGRAFLRGVFCLFLNYFFEVQNASHAFGTLVYHLISFGVFQLFWNFFGCHGRGVPTFLSSDSPSTFFDCSTFLPQTRCWKLFLEFTWKSDLYNLGIFKTPFSHNFWRKELFKSPWYNSFRQFISRIILN